MKNLFYLSLLLPLILKGKDYQSFYSDKIATYENTFGYFKSVRFDSVKDISGDSLFYPFYTLNSNHEQQECISPYIASWIGKKVVIKSKGDNYFINKKNDSVLIKTQAALNESWCAAIVDDTIKVECEVTELDTFSFLRINDSVKTISFQLLDTANKSISGYLNSMKLLLSKKYGLIRTLNFSLFPYYNNASIRFNDVLAEFDLRGLSTAEKGLLNLRYMDVYDFNAGDEIHVKSHETYYEDYETKKQIYKYLQRDSYDDSIVYKVLLKEEYEENTVDTFIHEITTDTVEQVIKPDSLFDKLPGEFILNENDVSVYNLEISGDTIVKYDLYDYPAFNPINDSCLQKLMADGCFPQK